MNKDSAQIARYIRLQAHAEQNYRTAYEVDVRTRLVYRRVRELGWTLSRLLGLERTPPGLQSGIRAMDFTVAPFEDGATRVFIDVTDLVTLGKATGIQRVVQGIASHASRAGFAAPVVLFNGQFCHAAAAGDLAPVEYRRGDVVFLVDAGWNRVEDYAPALEKARAAGAKIVACIYDLIPVIYPSLYPPALVADFQSWLWLLFRNADAAVGISRLSAEHFVAYAQFMGASLPAGFQLGWWRLGADLPVEAAGEPDPATRKIAETVFFLSVGTVEVRKGYPVTLHAFEKLWAQGVDAHFVIAGRSGWNAGAFEDHLRAHPEMGRRLHWLDNASDADLQFLYGKARAVIMASFAEGFGLPIVEAAQKGAPVIASDIPVFREIAGDDVAYFDVLDPDSLAVRIREALTGPTRAPKIAHVSWRDSTDELMKLLRDGAYQQTLSA